MVMYKEIIKQAEELKDKLIKQRRDLHKYPETGWFEMHTSSIVARKLTDMGYQVLTGRDVCDAASRMGLPSEEKLEEEYNRAIMQGADKEFAERTRGGFTGVIGILDCGEGPTVAMRFDMDALSICEDTTDKHRPYTEGFTSLNSGMMHACGHDGHTAVGLGVAEVMMKNRDKLKGKIKLIFQPAEEGVRGAKSIVEKGHLDDVDYVLAAHLGGEKDIPSCPIGVSPGETLATTKFDVTFHGKAAHAAMAPQMGNNAMLAAATAILNIYAIPRHGSSSTRVNVGRMEAGSGRNVICDTAKLEAEVRADSSEANKFLEDYAFRIIAAAANMHGCTYEIKMMGAAPSLHNTQDLNERLMDVCQSDIGLKVQVLKGGAAGSEDFSYMSERVQSHGGKACYFNLLTQCAGLFHNSLFDFDEKALVNGVKAFCAITYDILKKAEA